jgi:CP family cyanate transporter-like MFS transporter
VTVPTARRALWRGRILAALGILLVAANLRTAVAALSPIFGEIRLDFSVSSLGVGFLGMLPPICFAVFGIITPIFTRRASLEVVISVALGVMLAGDTVRALAGSFALLAIGSAITFAGMAVGNVLLPPLVKRYFPDRIGLMTSMYATVLALSTLLPPLIAVPVADAAGWRFSVGMWGVFALAALLPWLLVIARTHPAHSDPGEVIEQADGTVMKRIWHAPIAWALGGTFALSSLNAYAMFAWLPELLHDSVGLPAAQGGALLSLYAGMGIPASLLIPILAARLKNVALLIYLGIACFLVGDLGLILIPGTATWLWVAIAGLGPLLFPLCLVLINARSRTHTGAVALSGFVQGFGYLIGSLGPLVVGLLHQITGGWLWPLVFLLCTALCCLFFAAIVARPRMLEEQLAHRADAVGA